MKRFAMAAVLLVAASAGAFQPTGELVFRFPGGVETAGFDASTVVGPRVNLSRRSDGSWGGVLHGQGVDITVTDDQLIGAGLKLKVDRTEDCLRVRGMWGGGPVKIELGPAGKCLKVDEWLVGSRSPLGSVFGSNQVLEMKGAAAGEDRPLPQVIFSILAVRGVFGSGGAVRNSAEFKR